MLTLQFWWYTFGPFSSKDAKRQYPNPGEVVMLYRKRAEMTRQTLAYRLGISISMACHMENESIGLDSITRCRKIISLLHMPAFLLGLDALPHLQEEGPSWWIRENYHSFAAGDDGYPPIGQVIKYYRNCKLQQAQQAKGKGTDPDEERWTQHGLAVALGVSEFTVRKMENCHKGLDSISRRQALSFLLDIPPVLLGLDSLSHEPAMKQEYSPLIRSTTSKIITLEKDVFLKYHKSQEVLWTEYFTSHGQDVVSKALRELKQFQNIRSLTKGEQQQKIIEMQSLSHQFIADVALERRDFDTVLVHADQAVSDARNIKNDELLAVSLLRRSRAEYTRGNFAAALQYIDEATHISEDAPAHIKGSVLQSAGMIHAHVVQDNDDIGQALVLLDQAGTIARAGNFGEDPYFLKFSVGMYHIRRATALIAVGRLVARLRKEKLNEALEQLELAQKSTSPDMTRRQALIHLFRAQAYCGLGEHCSSVKEALLALGVFEQIHSTINIGYITDLYNELRASTYGNAPLVSRLGWELKEIGTLNVTPPFLSHSHRDSSC